MNTRFQSEPRTRLPKWVCGLQNRTLVLILLISGALAFAGCDQAQLDEAQPETAVSLEDALSTQAGFESLIVSMYDRLQGTALYGQQYILYPEALSDNAQQAPGGTTNRYAQVFPNTDRTHMGGYGGLYDTVNEANLIAANIDNLGDLPEGRAEDIRDRILGEALFFRALAYFDLVRIYSFVPGEVPPAAGDFTLGVPLRLEPTTGVPERIPRSETAQEIYDQVIADLTQAETLLTDNSETFEAPARINAGGVAALLSRVHLYLGNYAEVETAAGRALDKATATVVDGSDEEAFAAAWNAASYSGSLFELTMTPGQNATGGGSALQDLTFNYGGNFAFEVLPSSDVISTFATEDVRNTLFTQDANGNTFYTKYSGTRGFLADRIPIIRVAEVYLNRAEARAEDPDLGDALADLNFIRQRRGISAVTGVSGDALVDEVLAERRRELLFEGHRFFDFKRRGAPIPKPNATRSTIEFGGLISDAKLYVAPIPNGEVQANPLIEQNPGY